MRIDKLTTAFQQALQDAQSLAVARDNPYIEPSHLLAAMLAAARRPEGAARPGRCQHRGAGYRDGNRDPQPAQVQGGGQPVQPGAT
jgi:ATP-dependent Clp protease ATP-binding subunit ClpB